MFEKDNAPDEYKNIFNEFHKALSDKESAISTKLSESENKALRGLHCASPSVILRPPWAPHHAARAQD